MTGGIAGTTLLRKLIKCNLCTTILTNFRQKMRKAYRMTLNGTMNVM